MNYDQLKDAVKACPEARAHNLDLSSREASATEERSPIRDQTQADFGAEYHGFTGFESAGKGSNFRRRRRASRKPDSLLASLLSLFAGKR